jgi:hypothetical protein
MAKSRATKHYLLCIRNEDYPASLEVRKVYRALADPAADAKGFVRVIDESGEDYLYPADAFVAIDLPQAAQEAFAEAS